MNLRNNKSFVMVFALFVFTLLTVLVYALASVARFEVLKAKSFIKRERAYYLMLKGINDARAKLLEEIILESEDDEVEPINLSQDWAQAIEEEIEYQYPSASAKLKVSISDESAYIDLKTFKDELEPLFEKTFEHISYDPKDNEYLNFILDYEDEDDDERDMGSEDKAKNADIVVLDELRLIFDDIDDEQFKEFKKFWSLTPTGAKFNINTASVDNINFLSEAFEEKYMFAKKIFDDILSFRSEEASESASYYDEDSWSKLLAANPNLKTLFEKCFTINSSRFRIKSTADVAGRKSTLTAVYDIEEDKFTYWTYK